MNMKTYHAEEAEKCYLRNGVRCVNCGKQANGLAHMIPQRKDELSRFGWWIIHSEFNMLPACEKCNALIQIKTGDYLEHACTVADSIRIREEET